MGCGRGHTQACAGSTGRCSCHNVKAVASVQLAGAAVAEHVYVSSAWSCPDSTLHAQISVQAAAGGARRLAQEEAAAAAAASKLSPACDSLVRLAEPGDVYAHYNRAMSAAAVTTQIKAIEQRLGLKVRGVEIVMADLIARTVTAQVSHAH